MNPPAPSRRLEQLLQNLEDGCISGAEHAELMAMLRVDPGVRAAYVAHMRFSSLLHAKAEAMAELEQGRFPAARKPPARRLIHSLLAAAAVLALAAFIASLYVTPPRPAAGLVASADSVWSYATGGLQPDSGFLPGTTVELECGALDIRLAGGSRMLLEGPATLVLEGPEEVRMPVGRLWVRAAGERFTVHTERFEIVDLGTEFGVLASDRVDEEVHVAKGRVRVRPKLASLQGVELAAGQAVRANAVGLLSPTAFDDSLFQSELPDRAPFVHWSFDSAGDGGFPASGFGMRPAPIALYSMDGRRPLGETPGKGRFGGALELRVPASFGRSDFPGIAGDLPRTVAFWVKGPPGSASHSIPLVGWGLSSEFGTKWVLSTNPRGTSIGTIWGGVWANSNVGSVTRSVLDGRWHHLAYVFTGRTDQNRRPEILHYVDGRLLETRHPTEAHPINTECAARYSRSLTIGMQTLSHPSRDTFVGALDELYVVRGALTAQQIRQLMEHNRLPGLPEDARDGAGRDAGGG